MSVEKKLAWLIAIIACPFAVLLIPDGKEGA